MSPLVEVRGLSKCFPIRRGALQRTRAWVRAVDGVDLDLAGGECLAVVGESGSGKSTLGRCVVRLLEPTEGEVRFAGRDLATIPEAELRRFRRQFQMVFQDPYSSLNPRMRVGEIVTEPLEIHALCEPQECADRVRELLRRTGLSSSDVDRFPNQLSGGQRQRVAIARALASEPRLLVADEPVASLDASVRAQIVNLLVDLQRRLGLSLLWIAHDLALVERIADRVAVMYFGRVVEEGPTGEVLESPQHPYTVGLLRAASSPAGGDPPPDRTLPGEPPSHLSPPAGCSFAPRCSIARHPCSTEAPALVEVGKGHRVACHYSGELNLDAPTVVSGMEQSTGDSVV